MVETSRNSRKALPVHREIEALSMMTVSQMLAAELGREASVEELAAKMKMTEDEIKDIMKLALDALTVNGEGQAAASGQDEEESPNPVRNGWNLEEGL